MREIALIASKFCETIFHEWEKRQKGRRRKTKLINLLSLSLFFLRPTESERAQVRNNRNGLFNFFAKLLVFFFIRNFFFSSFRQIFIEMHNNSRLRCRCNYLVRLLRLSMCRVLCVCERVSERKSWHEPRSTWVQLLKCSCSYCHYHVELKFNRAHRIVFHTVDFVIKEYSQDISCNYSNSFSNEIIIKKITPTTTTAAAAATNCKTLWDANEWNLLLLCKLWNDIDNVETPFFP